MEYVMIRNNRALVKVDGVFRASVARVVQAELEQSLRSGCQKIVFDFMGTTFMDSPSLKLVLRFLNAIGSDNMSIINVKKGERIHNSFKRYQLEGYISSFI